MVLSCNTSVESSVKKDSTVIVGPAPSKPGAGMDTVIYKAPQTTIVLRNSSAVIKGPISPGDKPSISFQVDTGGLLSLKLQPMDSSGNVRINQIKMPDGKLDGPFGMSAEYPLQQKGLYTVIVGQNMMAGDPWTGYWVMTIAVK